MHDALLPVLDGKYAKAAPDDTSFDTLVPNIFERLTLTNGVLFPLGETALPAGKYQQMRLVLAENSAAFPLANSVKPSGQAEVPLTTPSGQQSGLKLNMNVDVPAGQVVDVVLDFDACKSVVRRGNGGYNLKPVIAVIPVSKMVQRISISVDDKTAFTSDQVEPRLVAIDVATNTIERTLTLPAPGYGTAPTADGRWLVVPMPKANKVAVVDLREWTIAYVIDVPKAPQEALVRPDGQIVYVSCDASGQVAAIRTSDWKLEKLITAGKYADGLAWASAGGAR